MTASHFKYKSASCVYHKYERK